LRTDCVMNASSGTIIVAALGFVGCGQSGSTFAVDDAGYGDADAKFDAAVHDAPSLGEAPSGDASSGDGGIKLGCSSDLQRVVNGDGSVVTVCAPNQGCAAGECIAACAAAAANHGTLGCDFWIATPSADPTLLPACFAVFITNGWQKGATVEVSRDATSYDATKFSLIPSATTPSSSWPAIPASGIPVASVGILFLSQDPKATNDVDVPITCPIAPAVNASEGTAVYTHVIPATGMGLAWHVTTDVPVTAYDILPYGGATSYYPSAELLIPTTAWGTNYYGVVPSQGLYAAKAAQWGQVVAKEENTVVTVVPTVTLPSGASGGIVGAAPAGALTRYVLNAGQYLQWQNSEEMSGTIISSDRPVGFTGGIGLEFYTSKTSAGGALDSAHQQMPPIQSLGYDYVAPPYTTRMVSLAPESIPYRMVGAVNGTTLKYDPPVAAAPSALSAGQAADFETTAAFRVTSQDSEHPFYVGQMMTSCGVTGGSRPGCNVSNAADCCLGDPEFVNILPPAQFLDKYVFFTDVTYATTNLVFTRVRGKAGFQDVTLDCAGALTGWQPVGSEGLYEVTNIDLVRAQTPNGKCNNGPHTASSSAPFGVMVWGLDWYSSYAYPAGGNASPINTVVVTPTPTPK
jgi:hypothetical protein